MAGWTDEHLTVLMAVFIAQPFAAGDDSNPRCRRMAAALGRKPGAIDNQWRNIKYHLFRLDKYGVADRHVGQNVKNVVDQYRTDLSGLRRDARNINKKQKLKLGKLLS